MQCRPAEERLRELAGAERNPPDDSRPKVTFDRALLNELATLRFSTKTSRTGHVACRRGATVLTTCGNSSPSTC
jgi:hypothetical protein